jgi:hypothetical protein
MANLLAIAALRAVGADALCYWQVSIGLDRVFGGGLVG